jgi:hypothetical protein
VQVDAMRIILLALCFAAVGFLLRVLVALALEWSRWPSREKKTDLAGYNPSQVRGNLLVLRPEIPGKPSILGKQPQESACARETKGRFHMQDILWTAVTIAFFAASIAYVHFCDRVK